MIINQAFCPVCGSTTIKPFSVAFNCGDFAGDLTVRLSLDEVACSVCESEMLFKIIDTAGETKFFEKEVPFYPASYSPTLLSEIFGKYLA